MIVDIHGPNGTVRHEEGVALIRPLDNGGVSLYYRNDSILILRSDRFVEIKAVADEIDRAEAEAFKAKQAGKIQ